MSRIRVSPEIRRACRAIWGDKAADPEYFRAMLERNSNFAPVPDSPPGWDDPRQPLARPDSRHARPHRACSRTVRPSPVVITSARRRSPGTDPWPCAAARRA
jgi:hypothetical protein